MGCGGGGGWHGVGVHVRLVVLCLTPAKFKQHKKSGCTPWWTGEGALCDVWCLVGLQVV
jgi:hypothetical protein